MNVQYSNQSRKYIAKLQPKKQQQLLNAINKLPEGDVANLVGIEGYRLRVGDIRVMFSIEQDTILIRTILPRGQIYKR